MTVKELVSTHTRVTEPWDGVEVKVWVYVGKEDYMILSPDDAVREYGQEIVKEWFQTDDITTFGQLVEINILV